VKKLAVFSATIAAALAAQAADKVTYDDQILPIFRNSCLNCHNPDKKKAGLDLSTYQGALQGSENGKVLESGNAAASLLFKCVKQTEDPKMPPKGDKLSDAELALVEKWIAGQLLENATGKAVAASNNKVSVAVVSLARPDGPPPMPGDLPLEPYVRTAHNNAITALAVSPWAPLAAVGGQKQVILYNTDTLQPLGVLPFPEGFPNVLHFSRNGQVLLAGGGLGGKLGKVVLWDIKTGERIATVGNEFDAVLAADLSPDQQFVALGGPLKLLKIYSTKTGKLVQSIKKHTDWVTAIAFSADGKYLASADRSGGIQVWESGSWKEFNTLAGHKAMVTGLAFMPGVIASSSEDGKISLWDAKEGKEIRSWNAHPGGAEWVDFTPEGKLISGGRDKIAKVWEQDGKVLGQSQPAADIVLRAGLANDRMIVADWTGKIQVAKLDGKAVGEITANPPSLADRIAETAKRLADAQAALPGLQQQLPAAEAKLKAAQTAAEDKHKAAIAAAETHKQEAQKILDAHKAAPQSAEKQLAELKGQVVTLQKAFDDAKTLAEAVKKTIAEKQATDVPASEIDALKQDAATKANAQAEAQKQLAARKDQVTQADAALAKLRASNPATVAAAGKVLQQAVTQLAEAQKPAAPAAEVTAAEQELAKIKTSLDEMNAQLTASKADAERWKVAQVLQSAHNAHTALINKQSQYEQLVQAIKDAPQAIVSAKSDLANAQKTVAEAPAKTQEKEAAFAKAREAVENLKKTVADAEEAVKEKDKAAQAVMDAAPTMGDVATLTKKLETQNADAAKMREQRNTHPPGTPEYVDINTKYQAKKLEITQTQAALTAASAKNMEAPAVKAAQTESDKARVALDDAKRALKNAVKAAGESEKAVAQNKKNIEAATQLAARLQKDMPQIVKDAETQKAQAEQAAAATAKEVEAAKAEADKRRADYETLKSGGAKAAALAAPPSKS
jgi:chromosome segregation ATPase